MLTGRIALSINRRTKRNLVYLRAVSGITLMFWGGVGEWLNPSDCKSDRLAYTGSNPVPSTIFFARASVHCIQFAGVAKKLAGDLLCRFGRKI